MRRPRLRVAVALGMLALSFIACVATRQGGSGSLDPRFVAVHNTLSAMGLAQVGPIREGSLAEGREARVPLELPAGCTTIVAFGGDGLRDVDATLRDMRGQAVVHDTTSEPQAVLRACVDTSDAYVLVVKASAGAGPWMVATWVGGAGGSAPSANTPVTASIQGAGTCESPLPLAAGTVSGSTRNAESANAGSCEHSDAREVVYLLDVPRRQRVVLDVDARFDSVLYLRKDDCSDESAEVECNDDSPTGGRNKSRIEHVLEPGKYFVFVDGYNQEAGPYKLTVSTTDVVALSDACRRAPRLAPGMVVAGTTVGAGDDSQATCGGGAEGPDAPWRFDLTARTRVRLVEHSDALLPVVHLQRSCSDVDSEVACGEPSSGSSDAALTGLFDPGGYTVFADGREPGAAGSYTLSLETAPPAGTGAVGDGCGDAIPLVGSGGTVRGDTFTARDDVAGTCGGAGAADVMYRLDVTRRSRFQALLDPSEAPLRLEAWRRCGDRGSELACGDRVSEVLAPGTYFVGVDGATPDAMGRFSLTWTLEDLAPQAMACAHAPLLVPNRSLTATTVAAGDRFGTACGGTTMPAGAPDRVFRFALAVAATVRIDVAALAPGFAFAVALRSECGEGASMLGGAQLACSARQDRAQRSVIVASLDKGSYWVIVDGTAPNEEGPFTVSYTAVTGAR